ncbi:hypothetical protein ACJX0J_022665, partial [Zea mays]
MWIFRLSCRTSAIVQWIDLVIIILLILLMNGYYLNSTTASKFCVNRESNANNVSSLLNGNITLAELAINTIFIFVHWIKNMWRLNELILT